MAGAFQVVRVRHVGYTEPAAEGDRLPIVRVLPSDQCFGDTEMPEARHVGYGPSTGLPLVATASTCCRAVSPTRVQESCWFDYGIGIYVGMQISNVANCPAFRGVYITLEYDGSQYWTGSYGGMSFRFWCDPLEDEESADKLVLEVTGCVDPSPQTFRAGYQCVDPLRVNYQIQMADPACCNCDPDHTTAAGTLALDLEANCRPVRITRHIGYSEGPEASRVPLVAADDPCPKQGWADHCGAMTCPLVATITAIDEECEDLDGTVILLEWITTQWLGIAEGPPVLEIQMECEDAEPIDGEPAVTLSITVTCGADTSGSGSRTILASQLHLLDVTFDVELESGAATCDPVNCTWQWNEMPMSWSLISPCAGGCDCAEPPGAGQSGAGQGLADQATVETPCTMGEEEGCCEGLIQVRVTRT